MRRQKIGSAEASIVEYFLSSTGFEPLYGYGIMKDLGLRSGAMYPVLHRLTEEQLLVRETEAAGVDGRPPRKMYRINGESARRRLTEVSEESKQVRALPRPGWAGT